MDTLLTTHPIDTANVTLTYGGRFSGTAEPLYLDLPVLSSDQGLEIEPDPLRLLLLGLAGCAAKEVLSILRSNGFHVSGVTITVEAHRATTHPQIYTDIELVYLVWGRHLAPDDVAQAIELSESRYCAAVTMLAQTTRITSRYELLNEAACCASAHA
jgi:putative redox protein